jgi:hypothetical protein
MVSTILTEDQKTNLASAAQARTASERIGLFSKQPLALFDVVFPGIKKYIEQEDKKLISACVLESFFFFVAP